MNLWLSALLLSASVFLSGSAPTPEECQALLAPLSLADRSVLPGRANFLVGYTNHDASRAILKITDSSWVKISASPTNDSDIFMDQENKINGSCIGSTARLTLEGDTVTAMIPNMTAVFHVLPSCQGCLTLNVNTTAKNFKQLLKVIKVNNPTDTEEFHARSLYFFGPESTVNDSDLDHFKKQASCLGFSREPDYHYDPNKVSAGFCQEGEGLRLPHSR